MPKGTNQHKRLRQLDQFAELLSHHDAATGDPGGNAAECARRLGLDPATGNGMLQRLRRELGAEQAQ